MRQEPFFLICSVLLVLAGIAHGAPLFRLALPKANTIQYCPAINYAEVYFGCRDAVDGLVALGPSPDKSYRKVACSYRERRSIKGDVKTNTSPATARYKENGLAIQPQ